MRLSLKDFFFDCACCDEAVDETIFLLTVSPDSCECLLICGGIPVYNQSVSAFSVGGVAGGTWIKEDKTICADEIDSAATCF